MTSSLDDARRTLQLHFGYADFRAAQVDVIASVISGRDTLAVLPTGGGKSLCYQVPALLRDGLTVVVSPLISLMQDQVERLMSRGVPSAYLNSTMTVEETTKAVSRAVRGELKLLYVAPERFDAARFVPTLQRARVSLLAIDEAHCISEWGHDFRPSFRRIGAIRERLGHPQIVALTATATPAVRRDIARQLGMMDARVHVAGFDRPNLSYSVRQCTDEADKTRAMLAVLSAHARPAIVYTATRGGVDRVARRLMRAGMRTVAYHGGLDDARRRAAQEAFMGGDTPLLVATNAFGMGVDKSDVRLVIHHAMPGTLEAYYQEAGRAGRDGAQSHCVLLYAKADRSTHEHFMRATHPARALVERIYSAIQQDARGGFAPPVADIMRACGKVTADDCRAALAFLHRYQMMESDPRGLARVRVRLLATPRRMRRELGDASHARERSLLRAIREHAGDALQNGGEIDLNDLNDVMEGSLAGTRETLDALRSRQFLDVVDVASDLRLTQPDMPLEPTIDWAAIERRRARESSKLDAMEGYARTRVCRRGFVLRYFGDTRARERCAGCDNCLSVRSRIERFWRRL